MKIFRGMDISMSALTAEKLRMDVIANNVANVNTTKTPQGGPFKRSMVVFEEKLDREMSRFSRSRTRQNGLGVGVTRIIKDNKTPSRVEHDPTHVEADVNGNVTYSNVDITKEIINIMNAQRAYQANLTAFNASKEMALKALEVGRG